MSSAPTRPGTPARDRPVDSGAAGVLAELAFGSLTRRHAGSGRDDAPLAVLPSDALALDLSDPEQRAFGDYDLLERIGEGGMGVVYRARQNNLDREVAIKLLAAGPWASHAFIERFLEEARHTARMQHPNIVTVYEVGTHEDLHYFSMRLVRGTSLAHALASRGTFDPRHAAALVQTIAEAVAYAHSLGVLHLDLKPANVLLDVDGVPHVADFGLARRFDPLLTSGNTEISGTPSYMAPEQAAVGAQPLTPLTDIWGLGAILYELTTGEPPFRGVDAHSTLSLLREAPVRRPRSLRRRLPLDLEAIILRCLRKEPSERYETARALAEDLARFVEGRPVAARPLNPAQRIGRWAKREPRLAGTAMLAFMLLLAGLIATSQQWRRADANATRATTAAQRAAANAEQANARLWEGRREAALRFMQDGNGFAALSPLVDNIAEQERAGHIDASGIERREIGMILSQGVRLIDRMILPDASPLASALSADGGMLAVALSDASVRWYDTATLAERGRVDISDVPTSDGIMRLPRVLRFIDSHRLVVTLDWYDYLASPSHNDGILVDLDRSKLVSPPDSFADLAEAIYSADAHHALLHNRHGQVQLWQVDPWRPLGPLESVRRNNVWEALLGRAARFLAEKREDGDGYLTLRDPRGGGPARPVAGLRAAVTAWAESADGRLLAIGDARGRLYLVDVGTRALRQLPTPSGREITWIAFSEDDQWLAAARWDGAAFAFDVATGDPLHSGQLQHAFEPHEVAISHRERTLVVAGLGQTALWRLPEPGPNPLAATRVISAPTNMERAGTNAVAICLPARLLASADMNGEIRLWRVAPPAAVPALGGEFGTVVPDNFRFDGVHLPDVAWNRVRLTSTRGTPLTPWAMLPQPPGFIALTDQGRTLVATSGPALHVLAGNPLSPSIPPVALRANPLYATVDAGGKQAVLGFGHNSAAGFGVVIENIDLTNGTHRAQARVEGPLRQFELSADGKRLLAVGPADGALDVFDSSTLHRIGSRPNDSRRPVTWAAFAPDSEALWLLARDADDATAEDADLFLWNPTTDATYQHRHVADVYPIGVTTIGNKPLLATRRQDILAPATEAAVVSPTTPHDEATTVFARSHDGRMLAHFIGRDVQLYDSTTLARIGPPLRSNLSTYAPPFQLAFSPDDTLLLGGLRPWLVWPVAAERRPLVDLRREVALLAPSGMARAVLALPEQAERDRLREADPGPPPAPEKRPTFAAARQVHGLPIPARDPAATPLQLDLTAVYNRATDQQTDVASAAMVGYQGLRSGLARLDGIDYDLRGVIELRTRGAAGFDRATGIGVPDVAIAALHVLVFAPLATPASPGQDYARVVLHYADGRTARLPLRTGIEVPAMSGNDRNVPVGWVRSDYLRQIGLTRVQYFSNPRLRNPYPERRIRSLDLEAGRDVLAHPVFLAITVEPVISSAKGSISIVKDTSKAKRPYHAGKGTSDGNTSR